MNGLNRLLAGGLLWVVCGSASRPPAEKAPLHVSHFENVLGTSLELKISAPEAKATKAEAAALAEIDRLAGLLSAYDPNSEFSRWFRTQNQPVAVSPELFEVLALFDQWRVRTHGALDASAEVVSRVWKEAAAQQRPPSADQLHQAVVTAQQPHWRLDPVARTATHLSTAPLVLNSLTKSYIINRATDAALAVPGVGAVVVNIGGDLVVRGALTEPVALTNPRASAENDAPVGQLRVQNRAVATSGNYRRGVQIGDRWYSHIVDPRTGEPVDHVLSATVVGPDAAVAGAMATAFNVLTPAESQQLAASVPGVEYLLLTKDGQRLTSPGWKALEAPGGVTVPKAAPDFELVITLEMSRQAYLRRPFLAVWVEDAKGVSVRNIAVWFNQLRWLNNLREWYGKNFNRAQAGGFDYKSVAGATRPPGKYLLKWDGNDDDGKPVKPGKYTVYIETAREHGTHQLYEQVLDWNNTPKQETIKGNVEIESATFDYRKKTD